MSTLRLRRLSMTTALVATVLVSASGCIGCAAIAYSGEVRLEGPPGAFAEVLAVRVELCDVDCEGPRVVELRRVAADTFVPADCEGPIDCQEHRIRGDGSLPFEVAAHSTYTYELELVHIDGTARTQSGTTRGEERTIGEFPCRQHVVDAVIELS